LSSVDFIEIVSGVSKGIADVVVVAGGSVSKLRLDRFSDGALSVGAASIRPAEPLVPEWTMEVGIQGRREPHFEAHRKGLVVDFIEGVNFTMLVYGRTIPEGVGSIFNFLHAVFAESL
jgi:precorrin isomerase